MCLQKVVSLTVGFNQVGYLTCRVAVLPSGHNYSSYLPIKVPTKALRVGVISADSGNRRFIVHKVDQLYHTK